MANKDLTRKLVAEFIGSLMLVMAILGSLILSYNVIGASVWSSVQTAALSTGFWLFALVVMYGPVSGCHINPAVTIPMMVSGDIEINTGILYIIVQIIGGIIGTIFTHMMFLHTSFAQASGGVSSPVLLTISNVARPAWSYWAEFWGTFALVATIYGGVKGDFDNLLPLAVGLVVGGGFFVTSSTMFVNPQVVIARMFTYSIGGIRPIDAGPFIVAEILGGLSAGFLFEFLYPEKGE